MSAAWQAARQFDFWIGEWELTWDGSGRGTNSVHAVLDSNVILEQFEDQLPTGLQGMSVSTYNPTLRKWQQTWVDNRGNYLQFIGEWHDGRMELRTRDPEPGQAYHRMIFYNIHSDRLDWNWERSEDHGQRWQLLWKIQYRRKR